MILIIVSFQALHTRTLNPCDFRVQGAGTPVSVRLRPGSLEVAPRDQRLL